MSYAELQVTTNFSFLRGASHAEELFAQARALGISALGVVDRHSLAGMVRAHEAAKTTGVRLIVGCRLDLSDGTVLLVYPMDRPGYARLCRLLTLGKGRARKGQCTLDWDDVVEHADGLIAILVPDKADETLRLRLGRLRQTFGDRAYLALTLRRRPKDAQRLQALADMARAARFRRSRQTTCFFTYAGAQEAVARSGDHTRWDCTLEEVGAGRFAVRLGLRMARGLANPDGARIVVARADTPFKTVEELWRRSGAKVISLEQLANADAYAGMGLGRRQATWGRARTPG
jgi:DNA polymerase III alpha subunit